MPSKADNLMNRRSTKVAPQDYQPTVRELQTDARILTSPDELARRVMNTSIIPTKKKTNR